MQEDSTAIRKHVRQISDLPIQVTLDYQHRHQVEEDEITNVSLGGLCFIASDQLAIDALIKVRFPILNQETSLDGKVVWCSKSAKGYEIGLEFKDPAEVERLKTIEQIHHIERFREEVEARDERKLSSEQAAREWVRKYAGEFTALS